MKRPEPFVPLSIRFATGKTGTRILAEYGLEGLGVWASFLAACKANRPQGEISYASDPEGWALLGLAGFEPQFTLDGFFTFTGRMKQTRRTRSGRVSYVVCTSWGDWNDAAKREAANRRKSRSRAPSERDTPVTETMTQSEPKRDLDIELEIEGEKHLAAAPRERRPDELWDALVAVLSVEPKTNSERGRWNKALKEIRDAGGTAEAIIQASKAFRQRYPDATLTATALSANWGALLSAVPGVPSEEFSCDKCPGGLSFAGARGLATHMANIHGVEIQERSAA